MTLTGVPSMMRVKLGVLDSDFLGPISRILVLSVLSLRKCCIQILRSNRQFVRELGGGRRGRGWPDNVGCHQRSTGNEDHVHE